MFERKELKKFSDKWFINEYLKEASVESVLMKINLPISIASYHRLIQKYGIVGSAGRHTSFPEILHFFREAALAPDAPLEQIYREMPNSFKTSLSTLHRVYSHIEKNIVRRNAVSLFITEEESGKILVGRELTGDSRYGKRIGDITIPTSFSKKNEPVIDSIFRVLQQEVSTDLALSGDLSKNSKLYNELINANLSPFMYLQIVDTEVAVYQLSIPSSLLTNFSSFKLTNHQFVSANELLGKIDMRSGVSELLDGFLKVKEDQSQIGFSEIALLNQTLLLT